MFFEDINMLLPVETFHDEATNTVYTTTDRMGTYCLVDMEIFLDNLDKQLNNNDESEAEIEIQSEKSGAMSENPVDKEGYSCYAVNKSDAKAKVEDDFDAVFMIDCRDVVSVDKYAIIKKNIIETADTIFIKSPKAKIKIIEMLSSTEADGSNGAIKVVTRGDIGETTDVGSDYFCNIDEVYSALEFVANNISSGKADCVISDAVEYIYQNYGGRKTYVFTIIQTKALFFRKGSKNAYDSLDEIIDGNLPINISTIFADKHTSKYGYALDIAGKTGGITSYTYEDTAELMLMHIYGKVPEVENAYKAIIATGYKTVVLNSSLQQNYEWYKQDAHYDVYRDTDRDGLCDYQEIKFISQDGRVLVNDDDPGNVKLLTFSELIYLTGDRYNYYDDGEKRFYVKGGLERYMNVTGEQGIYLDSLMNVPVLPIKSDPTSEDGDRDGKIDGEDIYPLEYNILFGSLKIGNELDDLMHSIKYNDKDCYSFAQLVHMRYSGKSCYGKGIDVLSNCKSNFNFNYDSLKKLLLSDIIYISGHGFTEAYIPIYDSEYGNPYSGYDKVLVPNDSVNSVYNKYSLSQEDHFDNDVNYKVLIMAACSMLSSKNTGSYSPVEQWLKTMTNSDTIQCILGYAHSAPDAVAQPLNFIFGKSVTDNSIISDFFDKAENNTVCDAWRLSHKKTSVKWETLSRIESIDMKLTDIFTLNNQNSGSSYFYYCNYDLYMENRCYLIGMNNNDELVTDQLILNNFGDYSNSIIDYYIYYTLPSNVLEESFDLNSAYSIDIQIYYINEGGEICSEVIKVK